MSLTDGTDADVLRRIASIIDDEVASLPFILRLFAGYRTRLVSRVLRRKADRFDREAKTTA